MNNVSKLAIMFESPVNPAGLKILFALALVLFLPSVVAAEAGFPWLTARQVVLVITPGWTDSSGVMQQFERVDIKDPWREASSQIPVVVGKTGLAWGIGLHPKATDDGPEKKEGDYKAPAGIFRLSSVFGYAESAERVQLPYMSTTPTLRCVDDLNSLYYNRIVDSNQIKEVDWKSSERMRRSDELYRWGVVVDHNHLQSAPGRGSCIFLHIWRAAGAATAGCTAMEPTAMQQLTAWLDPAAEPVLVQLPYTVYADLQRQWELPEFSKK